MVLSRDGRKAAIKHILEKVFEQDADSKLHKAFEFNAIESPHDIIALSSEDIKTIQYPSDNDSFIDLPLANKALLRAFKALINKKSADGNPVQDNQWVQITREEFDNYRISPDFNAPSNVSAPSNLASTSSNATSNTLRDFKRGIKRDILCFTPLKDNNAWDNWDRSTNAQACAQGVSDVLNPSHNPTLKDEKELFDEMQKFMYAVFEKNLLTDKGKALVRKHQAKYNAQAIYKELKDYATSSTKASMDASTILSYITTVRLGDGKWKGSTHAFILHWQDQVRKYNDLCDGTGLSHKLQHTLLQNAVHPIDELRAVKNQADQYKTQTGKDLFYHEYVDLLLSAAQQYDKTLTNTPSKQNRRHVYEHDIFGSAFEYGETFYNTNNSFDIDSPINTIEAYATFANRGPRLNRDQWHSLPDDAKKIWDMLTPDAKSIILQPKPPPDPSKNQQQKRFQTPLAPNPRRRINEHDIDYVVACLHDLCEGRSNDQSTTEFSDTISEPTDLVTSDHDAHPSTMEVNATNSKKKPLPPGNIKQLLSPASNTTKSPNNSTRKINLNGVKYQQVNMAERIYSVSNYRTNVRKGALVDRGANGGVAGNDVRVIATTGRQVDIQGIDNHRMVNIDIVTAGAVINTQNGEVIAIMHQYAHTGKGKTIHSCGQMEAFKIDVNDKSMKVGGQ